MSTQRETVAYIVEQVAGAGTIRSRAMFGEYGLYCDEKLVALICDDELFVKTSTVSGNYLDDSHLVPPYPGAKPALRVPRERLDDAEWISAFIRETAAALPVAKLKKKRA